jgi:Protein of unknown function (DUF3102)
MSNIVPIKQGELVLVGGGDRDAARFAELYHKARSSAVDSVGYLIELGEGLKDKKKAVGHGNWLSWLEQNAETLGFGEWKAQRLMLGAREIKANPRLTQDLTEDEAISLNRQIWGNSPKPFTRDDDWYTPKEYIELARAVLGVGEADLGDMAGNRGGHCQGRDDAGRGEPNEEE